MFKRVAYVTLIVLLWQLLRGCSNVKADEVQF